MTTFYVSQTGSNTSPWDTAAKGKTTIAAGIALLSGGDTLLIDNGVYAERISNTIPAGSSSALTTLRAVNEPMVGTKGEITANVTLRPSGGNHVVINTHAYIKLHGLDIDATNTTSLPVNGYNGSVPFLGCVIEYCRIHGGNGDASPGSSSGILGDFSNATIAHNEVDHNRETPTSTGNSHHGIYLPGPGNIIEYNYVHDNEAYGLHIYPSANNNTIRGNRVTTSVTRGILIYGNNNLFYNNIADSNNWGIEVLGDNNGIYNNALYNNGSGSNGIWISGGSTNKVQNNILYNNVQNTIIDGGSFSTTSPNLLTTPNWVSPGTGDFHLQASSTAAIDVVGVVNLNTIFTTDIEGNTRPIGSGWDYGPYEYGAIAPPTGNSRRLLASDPFSGGTLVALGGNWQQLNPASALVYKTADGRVTTSPTGSAAGVRWVATSFTNDQYSSLEISALASAGGASYIGVIARASGDINAARDYYSVNVAFASGVYTTEVQKRVNGVTTVLTQRTDIPWAAGERIEMECVDGWIWAMRSGSVLFGIPDSDPNLTTGAPGILGSGSFDSLGDNWEGGNLNDPETSPPQMKARRFLFMKVGG